MRRKISAQTQRRRRTKMARGDRLYRALYIFVRKPFWTGRFRLPRSAPHGVARKATVGTKNWTPEEPPERFGQIPSTRGIVFICMHCRRPNATTRDAVLRAWGERGLIADAARSLRCKNCRKRGMRAALTPTWAPGYGSISELENLVEQIRRLMPSGQIK